MLSYLGHKITPAGIVPLGHPIDALLLQPQPQPEDVQGFQRFLGMIKFYIFCLGLLRLSAPSLMLWNPKALPWFKQLQTAFDRAKSTLASAVSLTHPALSAAISLVADASTSHVGTVLQQREWKSRCPLAFFSTAIFRLRQRAIASVPSPASFPF